MYTNENNDEYAIELAYHMSKRLTMRDIAEMAGVNTLTPHTYIYIDRRGQFSAVEKRDRNSRPRNEAISLGYVRVQIK